MDASDTVARAKCDCKGLLKTWTGYNMKSESWGNLDKYSGGTKLDLSN